MAYALDEVERQKCLEAALTPAYGGAVFGALFPILMWIITKKAPDFPGIILAPLFFGGLGFAIIFGKEWGKAEKVVREERLRRSVRDRGAS